MLNITNQQGNVNQNHNELSITLHPLESLLSKRQITSVGENVEKSGLLYTVGSNINCAATVENSMEGPKKIKNRTIICSCYSKSWVFIQRK